MTALWILLIALASILIYVLGWFVTARMAHYCLEDKDFAFWFPSFTWFLSISFFGPWAFGKKFLKPHFVTSRFNLIDFVTDGPRNYYKEKMGLVEKPRRSYY